MEGSGLSPIEVMGKLKTIRVADQKYEDGRIFCSMCTKPHPIAKKAFEMFFETNLGDPGLFPGASQLESEVVGYLADLLHGKTAGGFLVSGGTEANLMALWAARNLAQKEKPEVVLAESAHFSFLKICNLLNIKPIFAKLDSSLRVDPFDVEAKINKRTVAIVGTAGTAELGAIDPLFEISKIAVDHNVWMHVDAAFGGLILPFLGKSTSFGFDLSGVKSVTIDPHKMGLAVIPTGGIIFRDRVCLGSLRTETPYLTEAFQYTFVGTRTGASAASAWAVFNLLGTNGFKKIVFRCLKNTKRLALSLKNLGFRLLVEPELNLLAFQSQDTKKLFEKMRRRGWFISYIPKYDCIRLVIMPHIKHKHIEAFLADLKTETL